MLLFSFPVVLIDEVLKFCTVRLFPSLLSLSTADTRILPVQATFVAPPSKVKVE